MIPVADPFMASVPTTGIQRGRGGFLRSKDDAPYVSDPSGATVKTGPRKGEVCRLKYGSFSKTGTLIENDVGLTKHKQRNTLLGIGMSVELVEACRDLVVMDAGSDEFKKAADTIVVEADNLTRSWLAADRGSHGHKICEYRDRGLPLPDLYRDGKALGLSEETQVDVANAWSLMLEANGLQILAVEASCVDDRWKLAGTLDRIVLCTHELRFVKPDGELVIIPASTVLILDLKFGKCRLAHAIQVAGYRQSVPYDTDAETRGEWPWEISADHALIAHGDFGDEVRPVTIELVWVDLAAGRDHGGQCVVDAKAWATRDDVFSVAQIVVDPHYKCQHFLMGGVGHCWIDHAQIVEGVAPPGAVHTGHEPSPSTLSPVHPPAAGEGADVSSGTTPSPAMSEALAWAANNLPKRVTYDGPWGPDPARLALVDARGTLCATPNEGADLTDGFDELWDRLHTEFDQLPPAAKAWRSELAQRAKQRGVSFMAQEAKTERRYSINRGLIALAIHDPDDQILRELLAIVLGEIAWYIGIQPGHLVGSLDYMQAAKFAEAVDEYISPPPAA